MPEKRKRTPKECDGYKRKMIVLEVLAQPGITNAHLKREYGADHWCHWHLVKCVQIQVNDVTGRRAAKKGKP